jgi:GTPase
VREGPVIAIDGPSGSGKSTLARGLAAELGVPHIDTGALYRAATLAALRAGVDLDDEDACAAVIERVEIERRDGTTYLDGDDVEREIRGQEVTDAVSRVSAHPAVREAMVPKQRAAATGTGGVVEGRDIGTVVLPDADVKIWLVASVDERARRRAADLGTGDVGRVARDLERRDEADSTREVSPLERADDAWEIDTTGMGPSETVEAVAALVRALWTDESEGTDGPVDVPGESGGPGAAGDGTGPGEDTAAAGIVDVGDAPPSPSAAVSEAVVARRALPRVAVVGRPNVGKSTLVNRIIGRRTAIVQERPGVTRDRTEHLAQWQGRPFLIVDTGGWEHTAEGMSARIVEQAERAIAEADLVVFVVDVTVGALEDDDLYARLLRRAERPVLLAANKVDSPKQEPAVHELYSLGLGDPHAVSAAHGRGVGDLLDEVLDALPEDAAEEAPDGSAIPRVAVVGRPNVGKSSLYNRLVGEERSIVDEVPHTTRDAVDTLVDLGGEPWIFVDTAGLRRRYRHGEETELYSVDRTRRAVETAHLVLFVIDASEPIGEQEQRLARMVRDNGCGVVLVLNKWDEVDEQRRADLERELDRLLHFLRWAPRVNASALTGRGVGRIVPHLREVWDSYRIRVPTAELNAWLRDVTDRVPPPSGRGNRPIRIRYATQVRTAPPTFLLFANGTVEPTYKRYLERELRARWGFVGSPLLIEDRRGGKGRG